MMLSTFSGGVNPNDSAFPMDTAGNGPTHETTWTEHVTDISSPDAAGQNTEFEIYMCPSLTLVAYVQIAALPFQKQHGILGIQS